MTSSRLYLVLGARIATVAIDHCTLLRAHRIGVRSADHECLCDGRFPLKLSEVAAASRDVVGGLIGSDYLHSRFSKVDLFGLKTGCAVAEPRSEKAGDIAGAIRLESELDRTYVSGTYSPSIR